MRGVGVGILAAILCACFASTARADVSSIADDGSGPWAGGVALTSALEAAAGTIASTVAGRPVSVRCESEDEWAALALENDFAPASVLGFVSFFRSGPVDFTELSPVVCASLQAFASATPKPTKCTPSTRQRIVKRVRGKRTVTYRLHATTTLGACFADGRLLSSDRRFADAYFQTAQALQTLVHESAHLAGTAVEAEAECLGLQRLAYAAEQLGDTPDDARAIAAYYAKQVYSLRQKQSPDYWSAECRENGALDRSPGDGQWP